MTRRGDKHVGNNGTTCEHAQHAENKKIALLIAILALFLSFSETLGKSAQTEAIDANVKSSDSWNFFQAKDIRKTTLLTAAEQTKLLGATLTDPAAKAAIDKQIDIWRKTAARYETDPKSGTGRKELAEQAKDQEKDRDLAMAKYHHYEIASARVSGRHRARLGDGHHRHSGAGLDRRRARRHWAGAARSRPVRALRRGAGIAAPLTPKAAAARPACRPHAAC